MLEYPEPSVETVFNSYYNQLHNEVSQWLSVTID